MFQLHLIWVEYPNVVSVSLSSSLERAARRGDDDRIAILWHLSVDAGQRHTADPLGCGSVVGAVEPGVTDFHPRSDR